MSASWPWIKFFPRDWLDNQQLKLCSLGARGLWITMLALMYEAVPPGRLKCTVEELARLVGASPEEVTKLLAELKKRGILQTRAGGAYFSPYLDRLLKEREASRRRKQHERDGNSEGASGTSPKNVTPRVTVQIPEPDNPDPEKRSPDCPVHPSETEVIEEAQRIGKGREFGKGFFDFWTERKWIGKDGPILNWKGLLRGWKTKAQMNGAVTEQPRIEESQRGFVGKMGDAPLSGSLRESIDAAPKGETLQ